MEPPLIICSEGYQYQQLSACSSVIMNIYDDIIRFKEKSGEDAFAFKEFTKQHSFNKKNWRLLDQIKQGFIEEDAVTESINSNVVKPFVFNTEAELKANNR